MANLIYGILLTVLLVCTVCLLAAGAWWQGFSSLSSLGMLLLLWKQNRDLDAEETEEEEETKATA